MKPLYRSNPRFQFHDAIDTNITFNPLLLYLHETNRKSDRSDNYLNYRNNYMYTFLRLSHLNKYLRSSKTAFHVHCITFDS